MNGVPALQTYFDEAASWDRDRAESAQRSARTAWRIAAAGWICALTCGCALLMLMPLKRVEPYVVRVDNSTGLVDVVPVYQGHTGEPEAVTRYFLTHYVTVCERFDYATAESDYQECGAFHSAARNQAWFAQWSKSNPTSPLNLHKDGSIVRAQVESVSFFTRASGLKDLAQVRYVTETRAAGGESAAIRHYIATIQYAYTAPAADAQMRRWNPLGFKVVDFKSEPEVLAETRAPDTTAGVQGSRP